MHSYDFLGGKNMRIRKKEIKSKSGRVYRLEFNDKKQELTVTCLSATGACSFLKNEIRYAMEPLSLVIVNIGLDNVTYKCPSYMNRQVIKRIQEC